MNKVLDGLELGFNPRPPLEVGATVMNKVLDGLELGFNPRPPLEVGATRMEISSMLIRAGVSILAHP